MADVFKATADFNRSIIGIVQPARPEMLPPFRVDAHVEHVCEELNELKAAETARDQVDALTDIIFLAAGRLYEMGVDAQAHWDEVCARNAERVRGNNAKRPGSIGYDAVKPEGWQEPDHQAIIDRTVGGIDRSRSMGLVVDEEPIAIPGHPEFMHLGEEASLDLRTRKPKIILLGHARHGKDTVAEMLRDKYGFSFESSSMFCAEKVMMPYFNGLPNHPGYASVEDCYADRVNYRDVWFQQIELYNYPDRSRLAREMFEQNNVYVGMRSKRELAACMNAGLADLVIWVDASDRLPPEDASSCTVEPWMAQLQIDNNGTLEELAFNVHQLVEGFNL